MEIQKIDGNFCPSFYRERFMKKILKNPFGFIFVFTLILVGSLVFSREANAATHYVDSTLIGTCVGGAGTSYRITERDCGGSDGTKAWTTFLTALTGSN